MEGDMYGEPISLADRLRGMRECLAYIREEALTYRLDAVAECLASACQEIEIDIHALDLRVPEAWLKPGAFMGN